MKKLLFSLLTFFSILALSSCTEDTPVPGQDAGLNLAYNLPSVGRFGRYYSLEVHSDSAFPEDIEVSSNVEWLTILSPTLPQDGIIEFKTQDNDGVTGREAVITLHSASSSLSQTIIIYQKGKGDNDENSSDDVRSDFGVGWGFNAFKEYKNRTSINGRILDAARMSNIDTDSTFQSVQEVLRGNEEFEIVSAYSMQEMSSQLTKRMEQTSNFLGIKKTIKRMQEVTKNQLSESYMAYARLYKIVASKSIDRGAIEYLVATSSPEALPFTEDFKELYLRVIASDQNGRQKLIKEMVNTYGTHLIIEGSAGGSIDYVVTFDRSNTSEFEKSAEQQCGKVFGKNVNVNTSQSSSKVTSSLSNDHTFSISSGSSTSATALQTAIKNLNDAGALPNDLLQQWLASVYYSPDNRKNLDIVDFVFMPIWDLFADNAIRNEVMRLVTEMAGQSDNMFSDAELEIDNYSIDLTSKEFSFPDNGAGTLVKVLYSNGVPMMEICSEYVPKIRSDRRVTIFYPIHNGITSHAQGLFPGDGDGNRPAFVSFYGSSCYVDPIDGYGYYDRVTKAYWMHGNLYEKDYNVLCRTMPSTKVVGHQLQFNASEIKYDVVKIGSGYWTRCNIKENMDFGTIKGRTFTRREQLRGEGDNKMLYAYIFEQRANFLNANKDRYGSGRDNYSGMAQYWYLPSKEDKDNLTAYIGNNCKLMFKGGITGFDAQFAGYFTTGTSAATDSDKCYIAFREATPTSLQGYALVLSPNYNWTTESISGVSKLYPVRLFRTRYYHYPNL